MKFFENFRFFTFVDLRSIFTDIRSERVKDFPVSDKIFKKNRKSHPHHLFAVDDDRKFVSINKQLFR